MHKTFRYFKPKEYLDEYYTQVDGENAALLKFFAESYKDQPKDSVLLEFGGGPTIYQLISAAGRVSEIHFADFLKTNLKEVQLWLDKHKKAFTWDSFIREALKFEGMKNPPKKEIGKRSQLVRSKITKMLHCDAFLTYPLGKTRHRLYDVVSVNFVPESITNSKENWRKTMKYITNLVSPGGTLIVSALLGATYWHLKEKKFLAFPLKKHDLIELLKELNFNDLQVKTIKADAYRGYDGMIFVKAKRDKKTAS